MPNTNTNRKPVNLRLGVQHAYLVTIHPVVPGTNPAMPSMATVREMVNFAVSGTDAENQVMTMHGMPRNQRERFIVRTVQCKGGPSTIVAANPITANPIMRTTP